MIVYIHKNCRRRSAFPRIITECFSHRMAAYSIFQIKFSHRMLDNPECLGTAQMSTIIFSFKNIILTGNLFQELHIFLQTISCIFIYRNPCFLACLFLVSNKMFLEIFILEIVYILPLQLTFILVNAITI